MTPRTKKNLKISGWSVFAGFSIALPIIAVSTSFKTQNSFDVDKIGVYIESSWRPAYEKAIEKYKEKYKDYKYDIQLLELGSFTAVELIEQLGYSDQKVADLIYTPIDRIPGLVENQNALVGFEKANELISSEFSSEIYQNSSIEAFAKKGEALIRKPKPNGGFEEETTPFYFGVPHSTEALILFYKGFSEEEISSIESITEAVNNDKWTNSMYAFKFNDLWHGLGVLAGFINAQGGESSDVGYNGQLFGKILVTQTSNGNYQSNMVNINGVTETLEDYANTPGWNDGGKTIETSKATEGLIKAVEWIAKYYNSAARAGNNSGVGNIKSNDWLLDGNSFSPSVSALISSEKITKAAVVDGPWQLENYNDKFTDAIPVPNLDKNGTKYIQAPGGWLYGFNQRNQLNYDKMRDMKRFLNILLTDQEVIEEQYRKAGKIVEGDVAKKALDDSIVNKNPNTLEAKVIKAVFDSKAMDQRPDGGNADFSQVWNAWDGNGVASTTDGVRNALQNPSLDLNSVTEILKKGLVNSFGTMLKGLRDKK